MASSNSSSSTEEISDVLDLCVVTSHALQDKSSWFVVSHPYLYLSEIKKISPKDGAATLSYISAKTILNYA